MGRGRDGDDEKGVEVGVNDVAYLTLLEWPLKIIWITTDEHLREGGREGGREGEREEGGKEGKVGTIGYKQDMYTHTHMCLARCDLLNVLKIFHS